MLVNTFTLLKTFVFACLLLQSCKIQPQLATLKLHQAVLLDDAKAAEKYIKKGASVNSREGDRGWTPLLFASEAGSTKIVALLIDHEAEVNMVSVKKRGFTTTTSRFQW